MQDIALTDGIAGAVASDLTTTLDTEPVALARPQAGRLDDRLEGRVALVTGADSGIGRAVAICFARAGADVAIVHHNAREAAQQTVAAVEACGRRALAFQADVGLEAACQAIVEQVMNSFGRIDVLVNNASEQHARDSLLDIETEQLEQTFRSNVFALFHLCRAALPVLKRDACIINTASVLAYRGHPRLIDYASAKGAIVAFTRSLAQSLVEQGVRVNAVAPGPLLSAPGEEGGASALTPGSPEEIAPIYVFLASRDALHMTGEVLHPNGGEVRDA